MKWQNLLNLLKFKKKNHPILNNNFYKQCFNLSITHLTTAQSSLISSSFQSLKLPFQLKIQTSSIPNSNNGVFLDGYATKGSVIGLYSGIYYPPLPIHTVCSIDGDIIHSATPIRQMWEDNVYNIHLNENGGYMNGFEAEKTIFHGINGRPMNPYAVGQYINHPSPSNHPNVISIDFLWKDVYNICYSNNENNENKENNGNNDDNLFNSTSSTSEVSFSFDDYCKIIPNILGTGPWYLNSNGETVMIEDEITNHSLAGLAFITLEDITNGSELFFDYKLHPSHRPHWYHVPTPSSISSS